MARRRTRPAARALLAAVLGALMALHALLSPLRAESPEAVPAPSPAPVLSVFVRQGCPHCDNAKDFLPELRRRQPHRAAAPGSPAGLMG